jgi:hypothetical protein
MHGYVAIVESISSALETKVIKIETPLTRTESTTSVTVATSEFATLTQIQTFLSTTANTKRGSNLEDAMVVNRKMRHSFSVESILNRKRNQANAVDSDDDDDESSSVVTSRRSEMLSAAGGDGIVYCGSVRSFSDPDGDAVRAFEIGDDEDDNITSFSARLAKNNLNISSPAAGARQRAFAAGTGHNSSDSLVRLARRYTINVVTANLLNQQQQRQENRKDESHARFDTVDPLTMAATWFQIIPSKITPKKRRASF